MHAGSNAAHLLVVDDDPDLRAVVRRVLESCGHRVDEATDFASARDELARRRHDLVLLDLDLGGADGLDLLPLLPRNSQGAAPCLVLSACCDEATLRRAYAAGVADFLVKPVDAVTLEHRVEQALRAGVLVTELERSQRSLVHAQRLARVGSFDVDLDQGAQGALACSEEARRIFGLDQEPSKLTLARIRELVVAEQRASFDEWIAQARRETTTRLIEHRIVRPDGQERIVRMQAELSADPRSGSPRLVGIVHDITDRRRVEEELEYQTLHDELTGLANRRKFLAEIETALTRAQGKGFEVAVFFLDLDRFKAINESLGPAAGDRVLRLVGERLSGCRMSRPAAPDAAERLAVARVGDDEFAVLVPDVRSIEDAADCAHRLLAALAETCRLADRDLLVTSCMGIALAASEPQSALDLLKSAETALYHAKERGRNSFVFYTPSMNRAAVEHFALETALRRAFERREFEVWYQPRVELRTGRIVGVEALARWRHPELGQVPPSRFILIAEELGLIVPLGEWVLRTACAQARRWRELGFTDLFVSVNLSAEQFRRDDLVERVDSVLHETGLPPKALELELTETILMRNVEEAITTLDRLKRMGIHVSVDDFGTGYSSLSYLKRFPIDCLKIDRSFIRDVVRNSDDAAITTTIVLMAHTLNLHVVAEGVETQEQVDFLQARQCDEAQGFYYSAALPADQATELLQSQVVEPLEIK